MSEAIEMRRFEKPDQVLDMKARGRISIIKMADGTTGMHAIFEPGWVWARATSSRSQPVTMPSSRETSALSSCCSRLPNTRTEPQTRGGAAMLPR